MKTFIFLFLFLLSISFLFSIFKLIKQYRSKADNKILKKAWRSILNHLLLFPAMMYVFKDGRVIIESFNINDSYALGNHIGGILGDFLFFYIFAYVFTYFIPWVISLFRKKEISASILGFFIIFIWLAPTVGSLAILTNAHNQINQENEIKSEFFKKVAFLNKEKMLLSFYSKHGYDLEKISNMDDMNHFLKKETFSLVELKNIKNGFLKKSKDLENLSSFWVNMLATTSENNDLIAKTANMLLEDWNFKEWDKLPNETKKEFLSGFVHGWNNQAQKTKKLLLAYNLTTPWELKQNIYNQAIKLINIYEAQYKATTNKELAQLDSDLEDNVNKLNSYLQKAADFESFVKNQSAEKAETETTGHQSKNNLPASN